MSLLCLCCRSSRYPAVVQISGDDRPCGLVSQYDLWTYPEMRCPSVQGALCSGGSSLQESLHQKPHRRGKDLPSQESLALYCVFPRTPSLALHVFPLIGRRGAPAGGPLIRRNCHPSLRSVDGGDPREVRVGQWSSADNYGADVQLSQAL